MRVATLGPRGTFSQRAAEAYAPGAQVALLADLEDVFEAVERRECDLGLVPLENSLEGSVGLTLDLLSSHPLFIVGEHVEPIRHHLLSRGTLDGVRIVLSHPQALAQCRGFLRRNLRHTEVRATGSTAHAARMAQEFPEMAAIAPREAAQAYGLRVLAEDIQDGPDNHTRFVAVAHGPGEVEGADKTSILFELEDRPGSLHEVLGAFSRRGVNLTKIESRPSKRRLGDYVFFIDLRGAASAPEVAEALWQARGACVSLRVLGSYPAARPASGGGSRSRTAHGKA